MVIVTLAIEAGHGGLEIVHCRPIGPVPAVCVKVALGSVALENVPAPPDATDHIPVPDVGALPPSPVVVPSAQIVCGPPAVAVVGGWTTVMIASADEAGHGELEIVQRSVMELPLVGVNVELGSDALENVPVPPIAIDHIPVPTVGVLPPRPPVELPAQIVWLPPVVAGVGGSLTVTFAGIEMVEPGNGTEESTTTQSYDPVSPTAAGLMTRVAEFAPLIEPPFVRMTPFLRH